MGVGATDAIARPRGRSLDGTELERFAAALAARVELWDGLVRHEPERRIYEELLADEHVTAWLICWMDDHDTGYHDHDDSGGAVAVIRGAVREQRLAIGRRSRDRVFTAGKTFHFTSADIHRVRHYGSEPAVTLHVYSPPLRRMGAYEVGADGVLARHSVSYEQELRPLAVAGG
ncbi:MAG TPA: cysteine dioxygenase family protein [Solirubrobacteraceae bacterium]|jgi:predicted metal-dependent enzyme (double-stranded beta helix superfamily)|nr:cysteine dioxygenase family protein [Solirubrobacteraceae bacterium]